MANEQSQSTGKGMQLFSIRRLYRFLAPRAFSVIMFGALFCTLAVKFFHSWRYGLIDQYGSWIVADISVLLGVEVVLAIICFRWPRRWIIRGAVIFAAVICTWSVMNAGWLIRTGTQILPSVLLPLLRDPINALGIIGVNLIKRPGVAVVLLAPSAIALVFFFFVLARPVAPNYSSNFFYGKILVSIVIISFTILTPLRAGSDTSRQATSADLRYNCQLRAIMSFVLPDLRQIAKADFANAKRVIPAFDEVSVVTTPLRINHNVVIVLLEGIQYNYTSLVDRGAELTPYLAQIAEQGVKFTNARSTLTHTTKALFALLTGRYPSASQDIAEAVPAVKPYASIATIVESQRGFRTAFFQSAKGNFESRPGLIYNLGFNKFWARDDLNDPNCFIGYLGCDEFSMLEPIVEWISSEQRPFLLTILCSVTHDPYEVPQWFAEPAKDPVQRYRQAVSFTDKLLAALDVELAKLNLTHSTIFCVIGDHGEAFGEHGLLGHERIPFDEVLRVPFCLRAPLLTKPGTVITEPVSSIDLTPTLLSLLGFDVKIFEFDGFDGLGPLPQDREVYFCGWMQQSPTGFIKADRKFIYDPIQDTVSVYDLRADPLELLRMELPEEQALEVAAKTVSWRKDTIFRLDQQRTGKKMLFGHWLCSWTGRVSSAKRRNPE